MSNTGYRQEQPCRDRELLAASANRISAEEHGELERAALSEKLEAVGRLAAEVAHEINNPLDYITNYLYLLSESLPPDFADRHYIEKIQKGVDHLAQVTKDLVDYAQPVSEPFLPLSPDTLIENALRAAQKRILNMGVVVDCRYACSGKRTMGSERMLLQVIGHVIDNALDAMQTGGSLRIASACRKNGITIEVTDTGIGIPAGNLQKIFDPFFSTKKSSHRRGTGLGLAVSYNVIRLHGGSIEVTSTEGKGTSICIVLPVFD